MTVHTRATRRHADASLRKLLKIRTSMRKNNKNKSTITRSRYFSTTLTLTGTINNSYALNFYNRHDQYGRSRFSVVVVVVVVIIRINPVVQVLYFTFQVSIQFHKHEKGLNDFQIIHLTIPSSRFTLSLNLFHGLIL